MILVIVFYFIFILFLLLMVALLVLLERKVLGLAQIRKSPNIVGIYSLMQTILDGSKLILKKLMVLFNIRKFFFLLSPILSFVLSLMNWFFIPTPFILFHSEYSILLTLVISSLLVYTTLWASWGSNNIYSLISGIRSVAQMISYEVVLSFFIMLLLLLMSSYNWEFFLYFQSSYVFWSSMFMFMVSWISMMLAELNRAPFDLIESESELVSGFNVEYSSFIFALLFLGEYMNIWFMSWITILLFFGGSYFLVIKSFVVVLVILYIRSLLPRFKFTDLIMITWKIYLPLVLMFFFVLIVWMSVQSSDLWVYDWFENEKAKWVDALANLEPKSWDDRSVCALMQPDMKKIIAHSTTSQLGLMVVTLSFSYPFISFLHMSMHAYIKSLIFISSGVFIHSTMNLQDFRKMKMGSISSKFSMYCMFFCSLSLGGFPFLASFYSKDSILENMYGSILFK